MGICVAEEVYIFFVMAILGALSGVIFDFFRAVRKKIRLSAVFVGVSDFIFLISVTAVMLYGFIYFNNGTLRWYEFLAIILGIGIYFLVFSKAVIYVFVKIIEFFSLIISYILKILLTPIKFLYKILVKPIILIFSGFKNILRRLLCKVKALVKIRKRSEDCVEEK